MPSWRPGRGCSHKPILIGFRLRELRQRPGAQWAPSTSASPARTSFCAGSQRRAFGPLAFWRNVVCPVPLGCPTEFGAPVLLRSKIGLHDCEILELKNRAEATPNSGAAKFPAMPQFQFLLNFAAQIGQTGFRPAV